MSTTPNPSLHQHITNSQTLHDHQLSLLAQTQRQEHAHRQRLLQLDLQARTALYNQEFLHRRGVLQQEHDLKLRAQEALQAHELAHRKRLVEEEIALRAVEVEQRRMMVEVERGGEGGWMGLGGAGMVAVGEVEVMGDGNESGNWK